MPSAHPFWNRIARRYDRSAFADGYDEELARFVDHLSPEHDVLDLGCGTGVLTFAMADHVASVHGHDTSARMIELANEHVRERRTTNVRFSQGSIFSDALDGQAHDVITAFFLLHLVDDPAATVARCFELTQPGGLFVAMVPCAGDGGWFMRCVPTLLSKVPLLPDMHALRVDEVDALVTGAGYELVTAETDEGTPPTRFLVARRPG